jgi:hypothetical protein
MREFFLDNAYSHLVLCPDDLLVTPTDLIQLIDDIKLGFGRVVSGMCNVDSKHSKSSLNITTPENLPHANPRLRRYEWITTESMERRTDKEPFKVGYSGFPLMAIDKDVLAELPFRNDGQCCIDVMFCWDCAQRNIPIYVDPKINLLHLKREDGDYEAYHKGSRDPFMYLQEYEI